MIGKDPYEVIVENINKLTKDFTSAVSPEKTVYRLLFGVDSDTSSMNILQNNLMQFEWVERNKLAPIFWGRNMNGTSSLTKEEMAFLHRKACMIAPIFLPDTIKETEEQGRFQAKCACSLAKELSIPFGKALWLQIDKNDFATKDYLKGFAEEIITAGYRPAFKANTDAHYLFDREYSRGMQTNPKLFGVCLIWATAPTLSEYDNITTTHLIQPDVWIPYAPSGVTRNDIAIWCYGEDCHPIYDDQNRKTSFNINLIRNEQLIVRTMC